MSDMQRHLPWIVVGLIVAALPLAACQAAQARTGSGDESVVKPKAATVEKLAGSEISRLTLTAKAVERLDIRTAEVTEAQQGRSGNQTRRVVPYSAVLYDATGHTWVYTNPEPLVYVRQAITIDYIEGDVAILADGPAARVKVVTVGASLLYGTEFEFEEG